MTNYSILIKDCLKGKPTAQRQLYDEFAPQMLGVCYRYTKSLSDAEDVLQEGFVRVFKFLNTYKSEGELGAWIRRIMVNASLNYLKKNKNYQQDIVFENSELHPVSYEDPEITVNVKELADLVRQLPTGYQTIFNLFAIEGYSHVEIGKLLGINEGTSRSQYMRARQLLISWIQNSAGSKKLFYANK